MEYNTVLQAHKGAGVNGTINRREVVRGRASSLMQAFFTRAALAFGCVVIASTAAILTGAAVFAQELNPGAIEAAIKESGDFPTTRQFSARVTEKEVRIATYTDKESTQPIADCKIDAILLARRIIQKFPSAVRVVVDFYPTVRRTTFRQVSVTKGEILAFGSGQINQEEMLAGLRVEDVADSEYLEQKRKAEENDKKRNEDAASSAKKVSSDPKPQSSPSSQSGSVEYNAGTISFEYPSSWKIDSEHDGDSIVYLDSSSSTKSESGVELKLYKSSKKIPVINEAQEHVRGHVSYKGHQITQKSKLVKFGVNSTFTGVTESFSYIADDGDRWFEEHIYFGWPGMVYKIRFESTREDYNQMNMLFKKLLSTMKVRNR